MTQTTQLGRVATTVHTNDQGCTQVTYHSTVEVAFTNKAIVLNHGGWMTNTTRTRMNQASNQFNLGYRVFQKDFSWFVSFKDKVIPFEENTLELSR